MVILYFLLMLVYSPKALSANECTKYKIKYQKIQLLQKKRHSVKQSVILHDKAQKAWQDWNDCKKGKKEKS